MSVYFLFWNVTQSRFKGKVCHVLSKIGPIQASSHHEPTARKPVKDYRLSFCKLLHILAVLVVVFADVAEVRRKGLDSQGTWDLPTFPLNDHTCHKTHTPQTESERQTVERRDPTEGTCVLQTLWSPGQQQGRQVRGKEALLYTREAAQVRLVTIYVFSWSLDGYFL